MEGNERNRMFEFSWQIREIEEEGEEEGGRHEGRKEGREGGGKGEKNCLLKRMT